MQSQNTTQQEFIRFFEILFRKKWLILFFMILFLIPAIYINRTTKPTYKATVKIVYEFKENTITETQRLPYSFNATYIKNLTQEIESWSLAEEVTQSLPANILIGFIDIEERGREYSIAELTDILRDHISSGSVPKSDIIEIHADAYHNETAALIANKTAEKLIDRKMRARMGDADHAKKTIKEQLDVYREKVTQSEYKLREYKENNQITNLDQESTEIFKRITEAEVDYNNLLTTLRAAEERLNFVKKKINNARADLVPSITTISSPWIQRLKDKLVDLQLQYTNLQVQNYSQNHPKMREISQEIEDTKKSLQEETLKIARGATTIDPLSQIQEDLEEVSFLEAEIHTNHAREKALRSVLDDYNATLLRLPQKELKLGQLIRDKDVADKIYTMLLEKYEAAKISAAEKIGNLRIIDPARPPKNPLYPNKKLNLIIGVFLGFIFGVGLSLIIEAFNISIRNEEDVEKHMKIPVLGTIPKIKNSMAFIARKDRGSDYTPFACFDPKLITALRPNSPVSESFRTLRTNIQMSKTSRHVKTLLVTSTLPQEGKSIISANLAIATAQLGLRTLLIDADLRKPMVHNLFQLSLEPGLTGLFVKKSRKSRKNRNDVSKITRRNPEDEFIPFIHDTGIKNLFVTTSGKIPFNPSELLGSKRMAKSIEVLKKHFDILLFDMPPVNLVTDAAIMAQEVEGVLFVIRAGKTRLDQLMKAKKVLSRFVKGNRMGVILNNVDVKDSYLSLYGQQMKEYTSMTSNGNRKNGHRSNRTRPQSGNRQVNK